MTPAPKLDAATCAEMRKAAEAATRGAMVIGYGFMDEKTGSAVLAVLDDLASKDAENAGLKAEVERSEERFERLDMAHAQLTGMYTTVLARADRLEAENRDLRRAARVLLPKPTGEAS